MKKRAFIRIGEVVGGFKDRAAPGTRIADVQRVWWEVAGHELASRCRPFSERDGVVHVVCKSSVWAQEVELMSAELVERINGRLGSSWMTGIRCDAASNR